MSTGLANYTVADVIQNVRQYISLPNQDDISDDQIISDLNFVWQFDIPQSNSEFGLIDDWIFYCSEGNYVYPFPYGQITSIQDNSGRVDMVSAAVYRQDYQNLFLTRYCNRVTFALPSTYNGDYADFTFTSSGFINKGYQTALGRNQSAVAVSWTDGSGEAHTLEDNGDGNLYFEDPIGTYTSYGTVIYATGTINFSLPQQYAAYGRIYVSYDPSSKGKPAAFLFTDNKLIMKPTPNQPYRIAVQVSYIPNAFSSTTDSIPLQYYYQFLIVATALRISERNNDAIQVSFLAKKLERVSASVENINNKNVTPARKMTQFCHDGWLNSSSGIFPNPYPFGN